MLEITWVCAQFGLLCGQSAACVDLVEGQGGMWTNSEKHDFQHQDQDAGIRTSGVVKVF